MGDLALFFNLDVADREEDGAGGVKAGVEKGEIGEGHSENVEATRTSRSLLRVWFVGVEFKSNARRSFGHRDG